MKILVTGSSGYVGSALCEKLSSSFDVVGVDCLPGKFTNHIFDISEKKNKFNLILSNGDVVINCAAIRFDFGITAQEYYSHNVEKHIQFLKNIENINLSYFLHVSSLAVLEGESIPYKKNLSCDDAYKATKYIQGDIIKKEMDKNNIKYAEVLPSAIYHNTAREDTNIGKLQQYSKYLPFIPRISEKKSLTYLPRFLIFLEFLIKPRLEGRFSTIDMPVRSVSEIIRHFSKDTKKIITIPFLKSVTFIFSYFALFIFKLTGLDLKLYPNRVKKLFKDTAYSQHSNINKKYNEYTNSSNQN